ncbi:hypothetical protein GCM10029976_083030 [Kribbella albertanoniae]|uniref:hypothetical protein n=1 Tax=Kribbella albertanoniae TaxID=1266829 RepID=UPI001404F550|nr:hypothetical protein [Kribbella albertanoniae]
MAHLSVVFASTGGLGRTPVTESTYPYAGTAREALSRLDAEICLLRDLYLQKM